MSTLCLILPHVACLPFTMQFPDNRRILFIFFFLIRKLPPKKNKRRILFNQTTQGEIAFILEKHTSDDGGEVITWRVDLVFLFFYMYHIKPDIEK